jgi:hypothetical protein
MDKHATLKIVWQPLSEKGWGHSPFNPTAGGTNKDGDRVFSSEGWHKVGEELRLQALTRRHNS